VRLAQENSSAAISELRRAIQLNPSLAEAHLALGLALGQNGMLDQAAAEFRLAIRLKPKYAEAHKRLGITLRRQGDPKSALLEFQKAVEADPNDPDCWYNLGIAQKSEGNLSEAIDSFRRAIALKPDFEKAHYNLGIALQSQGHKEAAQQELSEVKGLLNFRTTLAQSKALILQGVEALTKGENDRALQAFEQASEQSPTLPTGWHFLGVAWDRKREETKALDAWRKALELQPDYPKTHASLGLIHARHEEYDKAVEEFQKAVSGDSDDAEAHYNLGLALERTGHPDQARAEFTEALSLNPDYTDARMQAGILLASNGDLVPAANVYREVIRRNPNFAEAHNNLGLVLLENNDFVGAESAFRQALKLKPGYAPALQNLGLTQPCQVSEPRATLTIPHAAGAPELSADPKSQVWEQSATATIVKDCSHSLDYPDLQSTVRAFWTDSDLYLLFMCPYKKLNLFTPSQNNTARDKLWDRDVVEMFLGDDWTDIRHYREFEVAPTGDWIDLAIDLNRNSYDKNWRSGWRTEARIDEASHIWYAAAKIPLKSVSMEPVKEGTRWRMNLYRIEGEGPDAKRHFLCWQPTCARGRDPNHVPENFGTLIFAGTGL
jgi:Flp pilus assembly protein TadD